MTFERSYILKGGKEGQGQMKVHWTPTGYVSTSAMIRCKAFEPCSERRTELGDIQNDVSHFGGKNVKSCTIYTDNTYLSLDHSLDGRRIKGCVKKCIIVYVVLSLHGMWIYNTVTPHWYLEFGY